MRKTPVFAAHGLQDAVVSYEFGKMSAEYLISLGELSDNEIREILISFLGFDVRWKAYENMGHSACDSELRDGNSQFERNYERNNLFSCSSYFLDFQIIIKCE